MKVKEIYPNLFLYTFSNQYEMSSTFFRIQEFYESPVKKLRNKYFTYEKGIDEYTYYDQKGKKKPKFRYFEDWNGFNVPGHIVSKFTEKFQHDLTKKEIRLINPTILDSGVIIKFYIIGVLEKDKKVINHEIAHGLYYLNKEYKREIVSLIKAMPKGMRKMAEKHLLKIGYCKQVLKDELHAYFATGIRKHMICIWHHIIFQRYIQKIRKVFKNYSKDIKL